MKCTYCGNELIAIDLRYSTERCQDCTHVIYGVKKFARSEVGRAMLYDAIRENEPQPDPHSAGSPHNWEPGYH